jgi:MazG family protein
VFGDAIVNDSQEVLERWQQIKSEERQHKPVSALGDVPAHLPALMRAQHVQKQAQKIGFDWEDAAPVFTKVREELDELVQAAEGCTTAELEDEIGDLLFSVVNLSRHMGVAAEVALTAAVSKFVTRFRYIEEAAAESGKDIHSMSLAQMDDLWNSAKKRGL